MINNIIKYIKFKKGLEILDESRNKKDEDLFKKILTQKKMDKKIKIIQHNNISSPFIIGVVNGKIYIPNIKFTEEELEYIISHEINHFRSKDSLKKIFIQTIKYILWWNPSGHLFANNFNHILEIQCDLKTTSDFSEEEKIEYLEVITKIIKNPINSMTRHSSVPSFVNVEGINSLKQRFKIVLNYKEKKNLFNVINIAICFLALCLYIESYFIIIQPDYEPTSSDIHQEETIENSFIIEKTNGVYDIYIKDVFKYSVKNLEKLSEDLNKLPIYKESPAKNCQ